MRITTTDPISGADVKSLEKSPFVLEGKGENALKIYFENEENKNAYLDILFTVGNTPVNTLGLFRTIIDPA